MLTMALLGAGRIGQIHGRNIADNPRATLATIADADAKAAQTAPLKIEAALITPVPSAANGWIIALCTFLFIAFFAMNFAMAGLQSNFAVFTRARFGLGPQGNAVLFTFVGVIGVLVQGVLLRRVPTAGRERPIAMGGLFLMAAGFAATAFVPGVAWLYPAIGILGLGSAAAGPMLTSEVSRSVTGAEQGWVLGSMQSVASLTRIAGPLWAGLAFDHVGPGAPYWSGALWVVAGLVAASLSFRPTDRAQAHAT